jgi:hypothetical protein
VVLSAGQAQKELDEWVVDYNTKRPHQSLSMATPSERFTKRTEASVPELAPDLRVLTDDRSGDDWVARTVSTVGTISVSNQIFSVGKHRGGSIVDVHVTGSVLEVWSGNELIKNVLRTSDGEVRKKKAERH